jgi:hypothetical protein
VIHSLFSVKRVYFEIDLRATLYGHSQDQPVGEILTPCKSSGSFNEEWLGRINIYRIVSGLKIFRFEFSVQSYNGFVCVRGRFNPDLFTCERVERPDRFGM